MSINIYFHDVLVPYCGQKRADQFDFLQHSLSVSLALLENSDVKHITNSFVHGRNYRHVYVSIIYRENRNDLR
jgi:hypothetical protein